ncbi:ester cyclase [Chitinophaga japonensis]|uniref:SnoaL-like polyketide cyclase n=1 Tax=Chitinophaga japonensis TaxID=104662 RepID=A0A562SHQ0_CHIJA|nr:ester cyclase [Chitinophaga japonensis]TWI80857.1 SnoaL-like polyketide cyclase [Chitinophaga japonensis]
MNQLEQNKAIVLRFNQEFIEKGDLQAFEALVAPDFINHTAANLGLPGGREGVRDFIVNVLHAAMTDIKVDIHEQIAEGDTVVTRKTISGTQTGDMMGRPGKGQLTQLHIIDIVKIKNGQYSDHWAQRSVE